MSIRVSVDLALERSAAFDEFVNELSDGLARLGIRFDAALGGLFKEGKSEVARVVSWQPGKGFVLEWRSANWEPDKLSKVEVKFEPLQNGTRVTLEHSHWGGLLGDRGSELAGWFAREVAAPLLHAMGPTGFADWLRDRRARRPSGAQARTTYRDPVYHRPNFKAILKALSLTRDDYLLEVGCGGGALLEEALRTGCKAAAIDHSPEMVKLA